MSISFGHGDREAVNRMADEFKAIVTASFDNIGSNVVLNNIDALRPNRLVPPLSSEKTARRSALSFFRKLKSHATSFLVSSQTQPDPATSGSPPRSFVPPLPSCPSTPVPLAGSLPRNVLTRALAKHPHISDDGPNSWPKGSFFDDDDDDDIDRRVRPSTRRIASALARPNSRLSSAFAAAPILFGFSSPSASTPYLITERHDVVRPESRASLTHRTSKSSLRHKLRTKFSLPKLPSPRSRLSSPLTDPTPATPSYHSHPYSAVFTDSEHTYPFSALPGDRSITPEEDPFRKDEVVPPFLNNPRIPNSSPRSHFLDNDSEIDKEILGSRPSPMLSRRWSSDSESPPSSLNHTLVAGGCPSPSPSPSPNVARAPSTPLQGPSRSPLSLTFPLPPSALESVPLPGVTVRVTTPTPGPPPVYPPPLIPPPSGPLPCPPLADSNNPSQARLPARLQNDVSRRCSGRDSGKLIPESTPPEQTPGQRPPLWMDRPLAPSTPRNVPAPSPLEGRPSAAKLTQQRSAPRRRDRPATPFPLLLQAGRIQDSTGRLDASNTETRVPGPREQSAFDQGADEIPDSEVEPDRNFDSDKARKKTSVSSNSSAQTTVSSTSTTSVSTTTSFLSVITNGTVATTVSPSTSPQMRADKSCHVSQVLVTDEEGRIVSAATYNTPSLSTSANFDARSSGIYIEQGGSMHEALGDLSLVDGEQVIIGASSWTDFRGYWDTCPDVSLSLAGNPDGNGVLDVSVVEIQRAGKMCSVELWIIARTLDPLRIPGTYPLSSDSLSLFPVVPHASPIDISQNALTKCSGSALGLQGISPHHEAGYFTPSHSRLGLGSRLHCAHEGVNQHRTVLSFTATLPTTLRDLSKRTGDMRLLDGVLTP
ncbi:hypothetical protein BJV74DRAFT_803394 [Russula compacta]|nr:hypothetical protein BJV74DRAFT_803394 [Russula compacta]